ncbi:MAG TPA: class I SAM-dependent methyltransferase [Thermoleophilaceae bacterium]
MVRLRTLDETVIWHDVECASYVADLELWRALAGELSGELLDIGAGSGRVALDLAARGHDVTALDSDPALVTALTSRARERGLRVRTSVADARAFDLGRRVAGTIAPMQVVQLLGGEPGRAAMLRCVHAHLEPGGVFAAALADPFEGVPEEYTLPPLPDVHEEGGWVFSSTPISVRPEGDSTAIDRLRQAVSPQGELTEAMTTIVLDRLDPDDLEREAEELGLFRVLPRREVPDSDGYVGSTVVVLEAVQ